MTKIHLLSLVPLLEGIWQVLGHRTIQPCGPKLCNALCQRDKDCSAILFDEIQLSCKLIVKTPKMIRHCRISHNVSLATAEQRRKKPRCSRKAMTRAIMMEDQDSLQALVREGELGVNCKDWIGKTPVMYVFRFPNPIGLFDFLVEHKCDLTVRDAGNNCLLHLASSGDSVDIITKLIDDHCSDIECRNAEGETPIMSAAYNGHVQVVKLLTDKGADMNTVDTYNNTILHKACQGRVNVDMVEFILSLHVINIEQRGKHGRTAMMDAVGMDWIPVVEILLRHNADVTTLDDDKANVIHFANKLDTVKYLVSLKELKGFEKQKDKFGRTPVQQAVLEHRDDIVTFLKSMTD